MTNDARTATEHVLPLAAETLEIVKRTVRRDTVRVSTSTTIREEVVDLELASTRVEVRRVPVDRFVDEIPPVRTEGEVVVVPVVEEVVVRRLLLREEVHLVPVHSTRPHRETVALRVQEAVVSRTGPAGTGAAAETGNTFQEGHPHAQ